MFGKAHILFFCSFLLCHFGALGSSSEIPLPDKKYYSRKVDSLNELAFDVKRRNVEKAMGLLYQALTLATKYNYLKGIATNRLYEAGLYQQNGFERKALALYYKALEISRATNDTLNIARANQQLGNLLVDGNQLKDAESLYLQAIEKYILQNRREDIVNILNSLGLVKLNQKDFRAAKKYFENALEISNSSAYYYGRKKATFNRGLLCLAQGKLLEAKNHFRKSLSLDIKINDRYSIALTQTKLADIAEKEGSFRDAIAFSKAAFTGGKSISSIKICIEAIRSLCSIYQKKGDLTQVIHWQQELIRYQEILNSREKNYALNFLDILKEQYIKQLEAEKTAVAARNKTVYFTLVMVLACVGASIFIILSYFWYKEYKKVKLFSRELSDKNRVIEQNIESLNELNRAISCQNQSLEDSNKMKDKLLSIVSHDLRQPLVNTKSILDMLNQFDLEKEEKEALFSDLEGQYVQSLSLLDNLLFWIKGQMNGESGRFEQIDVKEAVSVILEEIALPLKRKNIKVFNELADELYVVADKEMLKVIFRNLLSNAVKFTNNGWIRISASVGDNLYIHIQDSGKGMDAKAINKIQEKVYFTTKGTNRENGSGFGLMICQDLILKHKGLLKIESKLGEGSTFTVSLPKSK